MPYTVPYSFDEFRENIEPPNYDRDTATTRKDHLVSLLKNDFEILDAFATGSLPKYTAVKDHADLDVFVVLHYTKHAKDKKPSQVLQAVQNCLREYRTNVRKNGQAVTLYYKTWPNADIVPVFRTTDNEGRTTHYNVPDMNSETWIASDPLKHAETLSTINNSYGVEFKRIIKMIKWWNHQHSHLLSSYHIEVLATKILLGKFSNYPWEIFQFFDKAIELAKSSLWYEWSYVDSYLDWKTRPEVIKRFELARDRARDAWYRTYNKNSDDEGAIKIWRQIFGDEFPAYG
jgi:hypothetical protein